MKRWLPVILVYGLSLNARSQSFNANAITGTWQTADKSGQVTIYKQGNYFFGAIKGGSGKEQFDVHNPDLAKRKIPLIGLVILKDFKFDGENQWVGGTIYDPKNGKTYSCTLTLADPGTLKLRGYIGFSLLGRTEVWGRISPN
jgi:uncharacterized protein (DUF2147 family)